MAVLKVIDPVTRLEGHLKIEVEVDTVAGAQQVVDAWASGTLFRGFEQILQNRPPGDAPHITQRICGVCPVSHGMASVKALENAGHDVEVLGDFDEVMGHAGAVLRHPDGLLEGAADPRGNAIPAGY